MTPRIAIIGGGSAHWTPRLLSDFVNTPSLAESEVVLMDTAAESLPPVQQLADHLSTLGSGLQTTATTDLHAALDGVQFVISGFSVVTSRRCATTWRSPSATGCRNPSATVWDPAASRVRCEACP